MSAGKSHCKWCGRGIRYIPHEESQKTAPIDDVPTLEGNILIDEEKGRYRVVSTPTELAEYIGRLHMNHWATCPKAAEHRSRRAR